MLCEYPFVTNGKAFGCGQCLPCRINKRRIWSHRIMLESYCHGDNSFITLTYADGELPIDGDGQMTLLPKDLQDWLKRFRKKIEPLKVRYFAVGEYGDESGRPHYHLAMFGFPSCYRIQPRYRNGVLQKCSENCVCSVVESTWKKGRVAVDRLEKDSAEYICGYTVKKMTAKDDVRLGGRHPEFARMSLRPGIGFNFMFEVASGLMDYALEDTQLDVPGALRHGAKERPIGRYLQKKLRSMVGKDEEVPEEILQQIEAELSVLRESAFNNSRSFAKEIADAGKAKRARLEARSKIFAKRKRI